MIIDARLLIYNSWKESIEVGKKMKQKFREGTYVGKTKNKENKERDL